MANHRPLVRIEGDTHVLPEGDTLPVGVIEGAVGDDDPRLSDAREWTAATVSQEEAEDGTATTRRAWTAQRVRQAIVAWWNGSANKTKLDGIATGATANQSDAYLLNRANHTGTQAQSTITGLTTDLAAKADKATTITAGTGLTGGGDLSANRSFAVSYGTTAGTAAQGNDSRLSDSREWTASTVSQAEAEAGTATTRRAWTAQRVRQAIVAWWNTIGTTVGKALLNLANPGAIRFIRINADNSVTARSDSDMRTDLGLGTAATATLTTAAGDSTAGRVLRVGDFGLGMGTNITNFNSLFLDPRTAWFLSSSIDALNTPPGVDQASGIAWRHNNTLQDNQSVIVSGAGPQGSVWARNKNNGTWQNWREIYTSSSTIPITNGGTGATTAAAARTNLGLGTSATANLTTSIRSTTPGEVMKVGDYGFGALPPLISGPDWNTIVEPGLHYIYGIGDSNGPLTSVGAYWLCWVLGDDASQTVIQLAFSIGIYNYVFYRTKLYPSGNWAQWVWLSTGATVSSLQTQVSNINTSLSTKVTRVNPPASASAAGTAGTVAYDDNYFYVCTAGNTWKRVALSSW